MFDLPEQPLVPIQWCDCGCGRCLAECHYQCETGVHIPFRIGSLVVERPKLDVPWTDTVRTVTITIGDA